MRPAGGLLFVGPVETEETLAHGRVVVPASARAALTRQQVRVVGVGLGAVCKDPDCERPHVSESLERGRGFASHQCPVMLNDWIVVRARCLRETNEDAV